ncbi:DMT family transporter [Rhodovarius sp.]|uniref:DMT family transporter n=1 Tax=Rhodovarius sp. TaxID=2972673 RepID=UPI00333E1FC6
MSPATQQTASPKNILIGVGCMCFAGLLFSVMGGVAKLLGEHYSSVQVSWARAFIHMVFLTAFFVPRHGLIVLRTRRPWLQLGRAATLTASNLCFFFAITFIPLAKASAISLTAPLIVALLAWPMLRERTTPLRILAVLVGFAGVLVVIRPGAAVFHPASLFVVVSATAYGVYQILTRMVAPYDSPATSALWSPLTGAILLMAAQPWVWENPHSLGDAMLFLLCGVLGAVGHYFVAQALRFAPANVVSPFQYLQLLAAVAVGFVLFGNLPDALTWVGAAIIVGAGLLLTWSQTRGR